MIRRLRPSMAELGFMQVMGRRWMKQHNVQREYVVIVRWPHGKHAYRKLCLDFAIVTPIWKFDIEVDGKQFHDAKHDQARDARLREMGWRILRIPAAHVIPAAHRYDPRGVRRRVMDFVAN